MRLTRVVAGVNFKLVWVCLIVSLFPTEKSFSDANSDLVEWLSEKKVYFKRIIPEQVAVAHYKLKNITSDRIILVTNQIPRECTLQKMKMEPIAPSEIVDINLACRFKRGEHFRDTGFDLTVISSGQQKNYRLGIAGTIGYTGTFSDYADRTYRRYENAMTVHIRRPPTDINWYGSPRQVLIDLANNQYFQRDRSPMPIGHVTIELNCTDQYQNKVRRMGGQGMRSMSDFSNKILDEGYGFSVLIQPKDKKDQLSSYPTVTVEGKFEYENKVASNNDEGIWEPDLMGFATFLIQPEECTNMVKYFDEYVFETENSSDKAANRYGFGADPSQFQGAGCATFVEEFFKRTSIAFYPRFFYQTVQVPISLFGNPEFGYVVNPTDLIFSDSVLSKTTAKSIQISFPDPNVLYRLVKTATKNNVISDGMRLLEKGQFGDSKAIYSVFDVHECKRNLCI